MIFEIIIVSLTIIALIIAFYTDIRTREVPDWLSYGLIFSVLGIRLIFSLELGFQIIISGVIGFGVALLIALFFYYTHQWGGGDSKLLMGMGAAIGVTFPFDTSSFDLLLFLLTLLFVGAIWGLLVMAYLAWREKGNFVKTFGTIIKKNKRLHIILGIFMIILAAISFFFYHLLWPLIFFPLGLFYLFIFVSAVEKSCFVKKVSPYDLTLGDWLAENILIGGKVITKKTLGKKEIGILQNLHHKKKIKTVTIREGIPFIPSFFFSYLLVVFGRKIFTNLFGLVFG